MKILIAEDDATSALMLRRSLEKLGHQVAVATDGEAAWEQITLCRIAAGAPAEKDLDITGTDETPGGGFHVLITDWMMPRLDGPDLLRRLRTEFPSSGGGDGYLYVIMLTSKDMAEDRVVALGAGADDFLVKPLDQGDLLARLEVARRILALQADVRSRAIRVETLQTQLQLQTQPLGEILIAQGVVTREQLRFALEQQIRTGQVIGPILIANGWATDEDITHARAIQVDMPYVAIASTPSEPALIQTVPYEVAQRHQFLPISIRQDNVVRVAVVNPWNIEGLDMAQRLIGRRIVPLLASETAFKVALKRAYRSAEVKRQDAILTETFDSGGQGAAAVSVDFVHDDIDPEEENESIADEAPIIRLVNTILSDAVRRRASDVHLEPYKKDFEFRYRIDGEMRLIRTLPRAMLAPTVSRLKIMADLDISERRIPQDGRISLKVDGRGVDLRVSTLPTQFGERVVLRVLDRGAAHFPLEELDFSPRNRSRFDTLIRRPHGIILVTGPTGSGKTTTLYAALNAIRSPFTNIMTCEDPIEYELDRISQSSVNPRAGLTFAAQLRAILRQDPDVILVGEIRDAETAETAFRAALTGHLVLSTLHSNEAAGAPTRLLDMGVPPFLIASALIGVVAQRLVRRLCPNCRETYVPDADQRRLAELLTGQPYEAGDTLYRASGCEQCERTGLRGRVAVHEVLTMDSHLSPLILQGSETATLRNAAIAGGMIPMLTDGLDKVRQGLTTLEDVQRKIATDTQPAIQV